MNSSSMERLLLACRLGGDALAVLAAFGLAGMMAVLSAQGGASPRDVYLAHLFGGMVYLGMLALLLHRAGLYEVGPNMLNFGELLQALKLVLFAGVLFCALLFITRSEWLSPASAMTAIVASGGSVVFVRRGLSALVTKLRKRGAIRRRVLIYGCGEVGQSLMKHILRSPQSGWDVVGFVDDYKPKGMSVSVFLGVGKGYVERTVLGRINELGELVARHRVDEILVTIRMTRLARLRELEAIAEKYGIQIGVVPNLGDFRPDLLQVVNVTAMPVLRLPSYRSPLLDSTAKRLLDLFLASLALLVTSPLWVLACIGIALDSPGPILFRQRRVGLHGKEFWLYKFRTMYRDSDPYARSPQRLDDARITRVGRLLRATGLDELPQLLNVLRGEMSLVGPRPEMPFIVEGYTIEERERLKALPGITGIWQVSADRDLDIHESIEYDLYYMRSRSFLLDLLVLFETCAYSSKLTLRLLMDRVRRRTEPAKGRSPQEASRKKSDLSVLVALDQRRNGGVPTAWDVVFPLIPDISKSFVVRILVAEANVSVLDEFVQPIVERHQVHNWPEYVPYREAEQLLPYVDRARIVITDLEHVANRAASAGAEVIALSTERRTVELRNENGLPTADIVSHLQQSLRASQAPARNSTLPQRRAERAHSE